MADKLSTLLVENSDVQKETMDFQIENPVLPFVDTEVVNSVQTDSSLQQNEHLGSDAQNLVTVEPNTSQINKSAATLDGYVDVDTALMLLDQFIGSDDQFSTISEDIDSNETVITSPSGSDETIISSTRIESPSKMEVKKHLDQNESTASPTYMSIEHISSKSNNHVTVEPNKSQINESAGNGTLLDEESVDKFELTSPYNEIPNENEFLHEEGGSREETSTPVLSSTLLESTNIGTNIQQSDVQISNTNTSTSTTTISTQVLCSPLDLAQSTNIEQSDVHIPDTSTVQVNDIVGNAGTASTFANALTINTNAQLISTDTAASSSNSSDSTDSSIASIMRAYLRRVMERVRHTEPESGGWHKFIHSYSPDLDTSIRHVLNGLKGTVLMAPASFESPDLAEQYRGVLEEYYDLPVEYTDLDDDLYEDIREFPYLTSRQRRETQTNQINRNGYSSDISDTTSISNNTISTISVSSTESDVTNDMETQRMCDHIVEFCRLTDQQIESNNNNIDETITEPNQNLEDELSRCCNLRDQRIESE